MALVLIPQPGQTLGFTRDDVLANFTSISQQFEVDHVAYNTAGNGFHNKVTFVLQNGTPPLPINVPANAFDMYCAVEPISATNQLYLKVGPDATANLGIPFTFVNSANNPQLTYTQLPSGVIMQWGISSVTSSGTGTTINLTPNGKSYTGVNTYSIQLTVGNYNGTATIRISPITAVTSHSFKVVGNGSNGGSIPFYWFTVGY